MAQAPAGRIQQTIGDLKPGQGAYVSPMAIQVNTADSTVHVWPHYQQSAKAFTRALVECVRDDGKIKYDVTLPTGANLTGRDLALVVNAGSVLPVRYLYEFAHSLHRLNGAKRVLLSGEPEVTEAGLGDLL